MIMLKLYLIGDLKQHYIKYYILFRELPLKYNFNDVYK